MRQPNIHEVRENLAEYIAAAAEGEEVLICRRNEPVARLLAITRLPRKPRPIGQAADAGVALPAAFWEPLSEELMAAFGGSAEAPPGPARRARRR